ncbi:MAG: MFS transporter [Syntrophobacteraceae bacterium]
MNSASRSMANGIRLRVFSWILYDFGMAWFSMVVLTAYFILYFKEVIVGEKGYGDFLWGVAVSIAMAVSVLLSPLLGAMADAAGKKKSLFVCFACLSILSTAMLYFSGPGQTAWAMFLVCSGYVGYTLAMTFYNAFLPEICAPGSIEKISGIGWGLGYIGGLIALLCMAVMVSDVAGGKAILLLTAAVYGVFALPAFIVLNDSANKTQAGGWPIKEGIARLAETFRQIRSYKRIFIFLIAYFFISDAISTVIVFFSSYTVHTLQFTVKQNFLLLMLIQISAAAGAVAAGLLAKRAGIVQTIILTIIIWIFSLLGIILFSSLHAFYLLSICAGLVLGGTQATARSFMAVEAPEGKQAEFFGFMTFSTKIAAIFGPLLYGIISAETNNPRIAILSLEVLFIIGLVFMLMVPRDNQELQGEDRAGTGGTVG